MSKKDMTELVESKSPDVRTIDFSPADAEAAQQMGIVIAGPAADRLNRAVISYNMAARLAVEAGFLLLSVKSELDHGEFAVALEDAGLSKQRASELMRTAKFVTSLPESQRIQMLSLNKSKVLALASADASVIEDLLDDDSDVDLDALSVRDLRQRIRELEADKTNIAVELETVQAERKSLAKQLTRRARDAEDNGGTPAVIADMRAEAAELVKKAELSMTSLYTLGVEIVDLGGHADASPWVTPTLRLALSGVVALRMQVDGLIKSYAAALGDDVHKLQGPPDALAFLDDHEIKAVAEEWTRLVPAHAYEADLRQHQRDAAKPKGKGRPKSAPEAPKA